MKNLLLLAVLSFPMSSSAGDDVPPPPAVPVAPVYPPGPLLPAPSPAQPAAPLTEARVEQLIEQALARRPSPSPSPSPSCSGQAPAALPSPQHAAAPRARVLVPARPHRRALAAVGRRLAALDRPRVRELPLAPAAPAPAYAEPQSSRGGP